MKEILPKNKKIQPRLDAIAEEFDIQREYANPFSVMKEVFGDFKKGPLVIALGAVGGNGAGSKAEGILKQLENEGISSKVVAMKKYLTANPLITTYLEKNRISVTEIDDECSTEELYKNCEMALLSIIQNEPISGVLSLGPRTYYPEAARRLDIRAMVIDGAVPDKWENTSEVTGYPTTAYFEPAYRSATYATTCGFTGWMPPINTYPSGMDLRVVQQPFSDQKIAEFKELRSVTPLEARRRLLENGTIRGMNDSSLIIVPTMDQVYLNPDALVSNGGFMTSEQLGQSFALMGETIVAATKLSIERNEKVLIYIRTGVIATIMGPILERYSQYIDIIQPNDGIVGNSDWLLLRKAGVTIGRAPLCVSTAEALAINDYQITTAVPGTTSDELSYMTEPQGLLVLNKKGISRTLFPGDELLLAIRDIIKVKGL